MKKTVSFLVLLLTALFLNPASAQVVREGDENRFREEVKVRPFRLGVKLGFPNLIGGNVEYVTPLLEKRLALNVDYSTAKGEWLQMGEEGDLNFRYLEGGMNYYFFRPGKGLYGGLNYGNLKYTQDRVQSDYTESADLSHSTVNVKLGAKLGGLFYFRPEVGYAFSRLPTEIQVVTTYNDGRQETEAVQLNVPGTELLYKGLMANIGFGFAF